MDNTKRNIVIAGAGRVGLRAAQLLDERGHNVTVIERDPERSRRIQDVTNAVILQGDATRPSVLEQANLARTDVVAAMTGDTGTNIAICMESEVMVEDIWTVARVEGGPEEEYERFVDQTIFPEAAAARLTADALAYQEVQTLAEISADIEILQVVVSEGAPVAERTLTEVTLPEGCIVIAREDEDKMAHGDTVLEAGTRYVLGVEPHAVDDVLNLFRG